MRKKAAIYGDEILPFIVDKIYK